MNGNCPQEDNSRSNAFSTGTDLVCLAVTATLAFVIYFFTLAPSVTLGFSGIFSVSATYGGVPHPPGYPLWTCYAWTFTKLLPFGNLAWRVAISSAVSTALACGLIALLVSRDGVALIEQLAGERSLTVMEMKWTCLVSGCIAGLIFGFSGAVWQRAVIADVWSLTLLLLTLFLCLMRRWIHSPTRKRFLFAALLVYGVGLTNSHALLALAPAIPVLVLAGDKRLGRDFFLLFVVLLIVAIVQFARTSALLYAYVRTTDLFFGIMILMAIVATSGAIILICKTRSVLTEWRTLLGVTLSMLLGLSIYLYVPLASMTNPPMNWGYARTVGGFVHTLSRGQYEMVRPTARVGQLGAQVGAYAITVIGDFGAACLLPAPILPLVWRKLRKTERSWIAALTAAYASLVLGLVVILNPALDMQSQSATRVFYSLSYVVLSLWLGYGITALVALYAKPSHKCDAARVIN